MYLLQICYWQVGYYMFLAPEWYYIILLFLLIKNYIFHCNITSRTFYDSILTRQKFDHGHLVIQYLISYFIPINLNKFLQDVSVAYAMNKSRKWSSNMRLWSSISRQYKFMVNFYRPRFWFFFDIIILWYTELVYYLHSGADVYHIFL